MARKGLKVIEMDLRNMEPTTDIDALMRESRGRLFDKLTPVQKSQLAKIGKTADMARLREAVMHGKVPLGSVMCKSPVKLKVFKPSSIRAPHK